MNPIVDFHIRHGYTVNITNIDSRAGCIVSYPANILLKLPEIYKTYMLYTSPCTIELFITNNNQTILSKIIEATITNIRLLVVEDIFLTTYQRGIIKDLIINNTSQTLFQLLEVPQTQEEKHLETQLCLTFRDLLDGNVAASDIEGFAQVLSCFENGGLEL